VRSEGEFRTRTMPYRLTRRAPCRGFQDSHSIASNYLMTDQQIEELADLIGPISTRKDRIERIQKFLEKYPMSPAIGSYNGVPMADYGVQQPKHFHEEK
jgi:hypothetical protein